MCVWHVCRWYTSDLQVTTIDVCKYVFHHITKACILAYRKLVNSSVPRRWQLPSHQHLPKITWQPGSIQMVHMYKNHWQPQCQLDLWSIVVLKLGNYGLAPQSQFHAQWLPSLWTPYEAPRWPALVVPQCKKCSCCWWPHKCLMSTTCYPCAMYTCKSKQNSQCHSACYLISLNLLCIYCTYSIEIQH